MTTVRDLGHDDRARLAARLVDEVGMHAVNHWRDGITVLSPERGVAVLACRCGAVLDLADMHRTGTGFTTADAPDCLTIRRITCEACA